MTVVLEAIKLNHDPNSAQTDALNIRKNDAEFISVPEWQRGASIAPEDSRAAYAMGEVDSKLITIQAKFRSTDSDTETVEIRAIDPANPKAQGCLYAFLRLLGIVPINPPPYGNCLGEVKARSIQFPVGGITDFETFELETVWPLTSFGLGIHTVAWQWQYRLQPGGVWQDLNLTYHRIYLINDLPSAPWQQTPYNSSNTQLPWTDALDKACLWASNASSKDEVAAKITKAINTQPLQSYTPATLFGFQTYYLSLYLQALDAGNTFQLNCTDCADAVTTFSNLLGCNLVEGRFFDMVTRRFLPLNGNPTDDSDWESWSWSYHEICWLNSIAQNGYIYDGCLQVDMDDNYTDTVHIAKHPIKMRFGLSDSQDYRYRLIETGSGDLENEPRHRPVT